MSEKTELQTEASATEGLSSTEGAMLERLVMRNAEISKKILTDRQNIKDVANEHGIGQVRARQIMHNFCRKANYDIYSSLKHSNTYAGGGTNDECLPYLECLRLNSDKFFTV